MPNSNDLPNPTLRRGTRGAAVRRLVGLLRDQGVLDDHPEVFTREVERAVREFQSRNLDPTGRPLVVDGVVGPLTWWALRDQGGLNADVPVSEPHLRMPRGGTSHGRRALRRSISEMTDGAREIGGNNRGRYVERYLAGIVDPPASWCAGFVSFCYAREDGEPPFNYSLGARDIRSQFKSRGWAYDLGEDFPAPGDIVVWWRGQPEGWMGHIGLVHHLEDGVLWTIEGNKGSFPARVRTFPYVLSRVERLLGFGRVPDDV